MPRPDTEAIRERWPRGVYVGTLTRDRYYRDDIDKLLAHVKWLEKALEVVRENFDKVRLINRADAEMLLDKGKGYMAVPHEECIAEIRDALGEREGEK